MSVVIRGMKMPKSCDECDLNYDCFRCILPIENSLLYGKDTENGRLPNCPLIELPPHGRLIDADALMKIIKAHDYPLRAHFNSTDNGMFTIGIQQAVDETPTIIEAEEVQNV